jgi:hypothetical protein
MPAELVNKFVPQCMTFDTFMTLSQSTVNPLPHGVLATFNLTAGGLLRPPEEGDISREKTILMTSLQVL